MQSVQACLSISDVYALHMVKRGCTMHVSMSCLDKRTVRNIVLGTFVVEALWEEDVCQVLANWRSLSNTINGPRASVVDEVGPFSAVLARNVLGGIPLVMPRMDLDWLHTLIRGVSYSHFFGMEPYGVVNFLRIRPESGWNAKILAKSLAWMRRVSNAVC